MEIIINHNNIDVYLTVDTPLKTYTYISIEVLRGIR